MLGEHLHAAVVIDLAIRALSIRVMDDQSGHAGVRKVETVRVAHGGLQALLKGLVARDTFCFNGTV